MNERQTDRVSPLISANELYARLQEPGLRIFDVRGTWKTPARAQPEEYARSHIPGATFLDWTKEFLEQDVPLNLASVAGEQEADRSFVNLGINRSDLVVLV